jgi:TPR repeat protein
MSFPSAQSPVIDAALGDDECRRRKHPRHAFIAWFESHPARHLIRRDARDGGEFVAELMAHPLYCLASRSSVQRWEVAFRCRAPSHAHMQQWHVYDIDVGLKQRSTLLARSALSELLVLKLMRFRGACRVMRPLHHAKCVVSRRHFLVFKNRENGLFREGQQLYEQERYSDAAESWGQAALLQHGASHAFLSNILIEGRHDVPKDRKRGFELAAAGAAMGCAHSKGALGRCLLAGAGICKDAVKALALGRESAAAGSCFGQFVVGVCYDEGVVVAQDKAQAAQWYCLAAEQGHADAQFEFGGFFEHGIVVPQDAAEAARLFRLAAAQGHADAQNYLGAKCHHGQGVAQDIEEAMRLYRLAAAQGHATAQFNLGVVFDEGHGVAQDYSRAVRWYRLAAAQGTLGLSGAQYNLGCMFLEGRGVAQDDAEAVRWFQLAAAQYHARATSALRLLQVELN